MANIIPLDPGKIDAEHSALLNPIMLLRRVRDVMAGPQPTQERLDVLTSTIAEALHADVCSVYLARPGDILELYSSYGLKKDSVHVTRLRVGEGLVGEIAATSLALNLADPEKHPKFAYRPETGEELYHAFVGVPILYSHKVIGVLVVQSKTSRSYSDELVEILHTVAMVTAELVMATKVVDLYAIAGQAHPMLQSQHFTGVTLSQGIAMAPVVLHRPKIEITQLVSDDPAREEERLKDAIIVLRQSVDRLIAEAGIAEDSEHQDILESYRMFSQDRGWVERMVEAVHTGLTAEAAVKKVQEEMHARMSSVASAYIQERIQDLEDLSDRLLYHLAGVEPTAAHGELPDAFILVARALGPAELLEYDPKRMKGVLLEEGSPTAHVAIIARMMDLPMIGRVPGVASLAAKGEMAVIDGPQGEVYIRPPEDVIQAINDVLAQRAKLTAGYAAQRDQPAVTRDGVKISLNLNVGLYIDGNAIGMSDVDGIGLFRTELPYLASREMPSVESQTKIYSDVLAKANGKRVIFRSFDIGGDKQVPYIHIDDEENPAMGWRATRIGLDRPVILRQQFRALVRAASGVPLHVMFPFIAEVAEFDTVKELLQREIVRSSKDGFAPPTMVKIGTMLEIPSLLFQLPELCKRVDFISVGSNDLLQFLFACDRGSQRLAGRYDSLSPIVMRVMQRIAAEADKHKVMVSFCGDLATKPLEAMALLGCGIRSLSMPPSAVGAVKAMVRSVDLPELRAFIDYACETPDHSIRSQLEKFARDHGVEVR